jgi:hypothetical protein
MAWSRLRWLRYAAIAALILIVPGTWVAGAAFGDGGLLAPLVFFLLFAFFSKWARDFPCPNCGAPFARTRTLRSPQLPFARNRALLPRYCRTCGIERGTSAAEAREAAAIVARHAVAVGDAPAASAQESSATAVVLPRYALDWRAWLVAGFLLYQILDRLIDDVHGR